LRDGLNKGDVAKLSFCAVTQKRPEYKSYSYKTRMLPGVIFNDHE